MLNPALDWAALADIYRRDQRICIDGILQRGVAERIRAICAEKVPYDYVYYLDGASHVRSEVEMRQTTPAQKSRISQALMQNATLGIGFLYCSYMLNRRRDAAEELAFLYEVFEYLNSEEMLEFVRRVSGRADLVRADGQYTRYSAGQYLTRHCDDVDGQARRLAYVFGFTRNWHPDWGGLLQFFEEDGTPRDAWMPAFNRLALLDTRHLHSVTYVTPFAGEARLSLTGWFHADS
jgi:SM-20-related protein